MLFHTLLSWVVVLQGSGLIAPQEVVQKFRERIDAGYQQMVTGARAGNVKQMPLVIVDFLKVGPSATFSIHS